MRVQNLFKGADIMVEVEGSDHAPVWAEMEVPGGLPRSSTAPALSARLLLSVSSLPLSQMSLF